LTTELMKVTTVYELIFIGCLALARVFLVVLHVFWFYLIVRMLVRVLRKDEFNDIRSDSDEENEDVAQEPKDQAEPGIRPRKKPTLKEKPTTPSPLAETERTATPNGHAKKEKRKAH